MSTLPLFDTQFSPGAREAATNLSKPPVSFDKDRALKARDAGMDLAAQKHAALLEKVRVALVALAQSRQDRCVTADDAQRWLIANGHSPSELGNAAGSLFRGGDWEFTGRWTKSCRVSRHANQIRVWRLK
jgi:hypothetical protein